MATGRRALIVSTGRDRGALAAARALHESGWVVGVGTPDGSGMVAASRAVTARHRVPKPRGDGRSFVAAVTAAAGAERYDLVFGGGDDYMAALSAYRTELPLPVAHPPFEAVRQGLDKLALTRHAVAAGLAAPRTVPATDQVLAEWIGPVVVKCRTHWEHGQLRPHRIDARSYPDAGDAARARVELIRASGAVAVLQQPVSGRLGALVGVMVDGRLRHRVQQVSSRLWPTPNGMSARAETVPVDDTLAARAEAMLRSIGWTGLVELQFLTDADGVAHLIDLNGRFYGSLALAVAARPGILDAWGRSVLGERVADLGDGAPGVRYAWLAGDLRRAGVERLGGLATDLASTAWWGLRARHSVWQLRDPGPTARLLRERLGGAEVTPSAADREPNAPPREVAPAGSAA